MGYCSEFYCVFYFLLCKLPAWTVPVQNSSVHACSCIHASENLYGLFQGSKLATLPPPQSVLEVLLINCEF